MAAGRHLASVKTSSNIVIIAAAAASSRVKTFLNCSWGEKNKLEIEPSNPFFTSQFKNRGGTSFIISSHNLSGLTNRAQQV